MRRQVLASQASGACHASVSNAPGPAWQDALASKPPPTMPRISCGERRSSKGSRRLPAPLSALSLKEPSVRTLSTPPLTADPNAGFYARVHVVRGNGVPKGLGRETPTQRKAPSLHGERALLLSRPQHGLMSIGLLTVKGYFARKRQRPS